MANAVSHAYYRRNDDTPSVSATEMVPGLFKNDTNNVSAARLARLEKERLEAADRLQKASLADAATKLATQVQAVGDISRERDQLTTALEKLSGENKTLSETVQAQERTIEKRDGTIQEATTAASRQKESTDQTIRDLNQQVSQLKDKTQGKQPNSLPKRFDGQKVIFMNVRSTLAVDCGLNEGRYAHAWTYDLSNGNQQYQLSRVDTAGDGDWWLIKHWGSGNYLYFDSSGDDAQLMCGSRQSGLRDCWAITQSDDPSAWLIKNGQFDTHIDLQNGERTNGTRLKSYSPSNSCDSHWIIVQMKS